MGRKYYILLSVVVAAVATAISCKKDEIDFDKMSDKIENHRSIAAPLVTGEFSIQKFIEQDKDSVIVIDGDTLKLLVKEDSIINYSVEDLSEIPPQATIPYDITSEETIDLTGVPSPLKADILRSDTSYTFSFENDMRLDSMLMHGGYIQLELTNNFNHNIDLDIESPSIETPDGNDLLRTISIPASGTTSDLISLEDHSIEIILNDDGESVVSLSFIPTIHINASDPVINAGDFLLIEFTFIEMNEFETVFGFIGYQDFIYDSVITYDLAGLENLTGTFNVTNPKINFNYTQSFGMDVGLDMRIIGYHSTKPDVIIDPAPVSIESSDDYLNPEVQGTISFNSSTVANIDELISFPVPDSIRMSSDAITNPGADPATEQNFVNHDSRIDVDLEIEIPMEFSADLIYRDTLEIGDMENLEDVTIDFADLHHWVENYFPIGIGVDLVLYDSINQINLDSLQLEDLIEAAPVDLNGEVDESLVEKHHNITNLEQDFYDKLAGPTTHLIIVAALQTTDISSVHILPSSRLWFQFAIDAEGTYSSTTSNDDE